MEEVEEDGNFINMSEATKFTYGTTKAWRDAQSHPIFQRTYKDEKLGLNSVIPVKIVIYSRMLLNSQNIGSCLELVDWI